MAKTLKAVVRTDKLVSGRVGLLFHVRLNEVSQNGKLVLLGKNEVDNIDVRAEVAPTEGATGIVLIADPVLTYDESTYAARFENQYEMDKGHVARGYSLERNSQYAVSFEQIENPTLLDSYDPETEDLYATATATGQHLITATKPTEGFYARVAAVELIGGIYGAYGGAEGTKLAVFTVENN